MTPSLTGGHRGRRLVLRSGLAAIAVLAVATGCGSDDDSESSDATATTAQSSAPYGTYVRTMSKSDLARTAAIRDESGPNQETPPTGRYRLVIAKGAAQDVIKVIDLTDESHVERELVLIRVNAEPQHREEILRTTDIFRAKVVDVTPLTFTLEATGDEAKLEALIELLRPMGIQELVRTGKVAIARGPKTRARRTEAPRKPRVSEDPRVVGFAD